MPTKVTHDGAISLTYSLTIIFFSFWFRCCVFFLFCFVNRISDGTMSRGKVHRLIYERLLLPVLIGSSFSLATRLHHRARQVHTICVTALSKRKWRICWLFRQLNSSFSVKISPITLCRLLRIWFTTIRVTRTTKRPQNAKISTQCSLTWQVICRVSVESEMLTWTPFVSFDVKSTYWRGEFIQKI